MSTPRRILFIAGEVAPFADGLETAELMRTLPVQLQEAGGFEARLTMPRYGTIHERKNGLHEVIRLSGTEVPMGETTPTLTVKVASIPETRLQVYFMDQKKYFGRKGTVDDKKGKPYADNAERALFFGRAVLETIKKLRWAPDVVHAVGWAGGLAPLLLRTEYAADEVFEKAKVVYTPDAVDAQADLSDAFFETTGFAAGRDVQGRTLTEAGLVHADAVIFPPSMTPQNGAHTFSTDPEERVEQVVGLYDHVLSEVPA